MVFEFYNNVATICPLLFHRYQILKFISIHTFLLLKPGSSQRLQLLCSQPSFSGQRRLTSTERQKPGLKYRNKLKSRLRMIPFSLMTQESSGLGDRISGGDANKSQLRFPQRNSLSQVWRVTCFQKLREQEARLFH